MRNAICIIIFIASCLLGLYVGGWLLFFKPISDAITAYNTGVLTGITIILTIVKCIIAWPICGIIEYTGLIIAMLIADSRW